MSMESLKILLFSMHTNSLENLNLMILSNIYIDDSKILSLPYVFPLNPVFI